MIKRFSLVLAVALVLLAFGIAGAGQIDGLQSNSGPALPSTLHNYVNPGGTGDVLLYNYYNARGNEVTYFTVVNTDTVNGYRVRVRLLEGANIAKNGACVPEEPRGSWEVLDFDVCLTKGDMWTGFIQRNPNTGGAQLCSTDTDTIIDNGSSKGVFPAGCVNLKFGANNTRSAITADNTLEGYIEIIGEDLLRAVTSGGTCGAKLMDTTVDVKNVLTGNAQMIGDTGRFSYNATAIADFAATSKRSPISTASPNLADGQDGIVGVNYILTKSSVVSIYDTQGANMTEYVLTAPTKRLSQVCGVGNDIWDNNEAQFTVFDDKEKSPTSTCEFSPCPPGTKNHVPFEVNVLPMNGSSIIDSKLETAVASPFNFGWFTVDFTKSAGVALTSHKTTVDNVTTKGWPMLGWTLMDEEGFPMQYKATIVAPLP